MKRSPFKWYLRWLISPVIVVLALAAILNTAVNPLRVTKTPWTISSLEPYRVVEGYERTAKSGLVRSSDWKGAIFGSSRMDIGFNPDHPALEGTRTANLALSAGKLNENIEMLKYACEHEDLDLVVFGIDLIDLSEPVRAPKSDFFSSPLAKSGSRIDRELQYYFGLTMLKNSSKVLSRAMSEEPGEHLPNGHWAMRYAIDPRKDAEKKSLAVIFGRSRVRATVAERIDPEKAAIVRELFELCRNEKARLMIVLPPNHASFNASLYLMGDADPNFRAEREFLTNLVAAENAAHPESAAFTVWDFDDFHPLNSEPIPEGYGGEMKDWHDITHPKSSLGNLMLDAMMGRSQELAPGQPAYGALLTPETLDANLARREAGFQRYREERKDEIAWIEVILADLKANASELIVPEE